MRKQNAFFSYAQTKLSMHLCKRLNETEKWYNYSDCQRCDAILALPPFEPICLKTFNNRQSRLKVHACMHQTQKHYKIHLNFLFYSFYSSLIRCIMSGIIKVATTLEMTFLSLSLSDSTQVTLPLFVCIHMKNLLQ
jgi:hypothetical protein